MKNKKKPTLDEIFMASCRYVAQIDSQIQNESLEQLTRENTTFYERSLKTFMKIAVHDYSIEEIDTWVKKTLIDTKKLPDLE